MPSETKYIAIGRGASTVLALAADEIGIPKDKCLSVVPFIDEHQHFINPIWFDLHFRTDERKQQIGKELYKVSLSCECEICEFFPNTKHLIIVCCLGTLSGLMALPRILLLAKQNGITSHVVASKPFSWETLQRTLNAENSVRILRDNEIDSYIYDMDEAYNETDPNISTVELFKIVDKKMLNLIRRVEQLCKEPSNT